jgi:hypothetical protein
MLDPKPHGGFFIALQWAIQWRKGKRQTKNIIVEYRANSKAQCESVLGHPERERKL